MSYILDALKKSDQQRQRGAAPTLATAQTMLVETRTSAPLLYGLAATLLVASGVAIGLLQARHPGQTGDKKNADDQILVPVTRPAAAPSAASREPAPPRRQPLRQSETLQPAAATPTTTRTAPPLPERRPPHPAPPKSVAPGVAPAMPAAKAREQTAAAPRQNDAAEHAIAAIPELPPAIRKQIPPMAISAYLYSLDPQGRMVGINDRLLREGDFLAPGIKLEEIRPNGMVFSFKGYRFRHDPQ